MQGTEINAAGVCLQYWADAVSWKLVNNPAEGADMRVQCSACVQVGMVR